MRRRIGLLVSLVAFLALGGGMLAATPAWATPPKHFFHIPLTDSVRDDALSDACGFDVFDVFGGNINVTLFYDQSGTLIREIDTFPTATISFAAPFDREVHRLHLARGRDHRLHGRGCGGHACGSPRHGLAVHGSARRDAHREAGVRYRGRGRHPRGDPGHAAHELDLPERELLLR